VARFRSGGRGVGRCSTPQFRAFGGRCPEGRVEHADVGSGRDDGVDPVEQVVVEGDVDAGEQVVQVGGRCAARSGRNSRPDVLCGAVP
jgi:hypothetical protein